MTAYANDLIEIENQIRNTANKLIEEGKSIELNINKDKTQYLIVLW